MHPKLFVVHAISSFPTYYPFASASLDGIPRAAFIFLLIQMANLKRQWALTSFSGHSDMEFDCGDRLLQEEVFETFACKHGSSSWHVCVCTVDSGYINDKL
ncbi:hypothetical protein KP509_1Z254000 [Ceratopteris richardii]|nr:hypothetical protein KP509_1Z254000 [Ceratopteris richardii]